MRVVSETRTGDDLTVRLEARNTSPTELAPIFFILYAYAEGRSPLADSLNSKHINGPWVGNAGNPPEAIRYLGQASHHGCPALTFALAPKATVRMDFVLNRPLLDTLGNTPHFRALAQSLNAPATASEPLYIPFENELRSILAAATSAVHRLQRPLAAFALLPWAACLIALLPFLRPSPQSPRLRLARPLRILDLLLGIALVVASTTLFLSRIRDIPTGRESDTFDYLSIAEKFGPPLGACIEGMDNRGYDRRAYLHQTLDRTWGYPLLLATVARVSGNPDERCYTLLRNMRHLNIAMLIALCSGAALLIYKCWTPSAIAFTRSGFVYAALMLDGYNVHSATRLLTEIPSRFLFVLCLLAAMAFWRAGTFRRQQLWLVAGTLLAFLPLLNRAEHALVETLIMPALLVLRCRTTRFWALFLTWALAAAIGIASIVAVSYRTYGVLRPSTASGLHLMNAVYRLPLDGGVHTRDLPPGVRMSDEERTFFETLIIPAGLLPGGAVDPYMALPGVLDMEPLELSAYVQRMGSGILAKNRDLWWAMMQRRYPDFASRSNWLWPGPITEEVGKLMNSFGTFPPAWGWPLCMVLWLGGRACWGLITKRRVGTAPLLAAAIVVCFYWHLAIIASVGAGEERHSFFATGFLPVLGALVVIDGIGLLGTHLFAPLATLTRWLRPRRPPSGSTPASPDVHGTSSPSAATPPQTASAPPTPARAVPASDPPPTCSYPTPGPACCPTPARA